MENEDTSTALLQVEAFATCIDADLFAGLSGCTVDCAPTYAMLVASEKPTTAEFDRFGAGTGEATERPATSLCQIGQEVNCFYHSHSK